MVEDDSAKIEKAKLRRGPPSPELMRLSIGEGYLRPIAQIRGLPEARARSHVEA